MSDQILGPGGGSPPQKYRVEAEPDPAALVAPTMREMSEPTDGIAPTPVWLLLFFFVLAGLSGYYIARNAGGFRGDIYNEHFVKGMPTPKPAPVDPLVLGRQTFNVCMQCHQDTGKGIAGTYPPLVGSPILLGDPATPVRILLHGLQGDITVEGATYNGQMPSWDRFSDEQIAAVLTYVRQAWTNTAPPVDSALVTAIRKQTGERTQPWTWPELQVAAKTPPPPLAAPAQPKPAKP
ncbi:MAG TPA: cytochrome c [Bryobacteraceae bacterium]|jgi:mono/diheme cytochrome c family protein|nr:cytochrome c [Bryobacteraceae bacterium]